MVATSELKDLSFFDDFSESELSALASIGMRSQAAEGETLFEAGAPAKNIYILRSGMILLCFPGGRSFPVHIPGQVLGWSALVSPFERTATGRCLTDVSLYQFAGEDVYRLMQMDANFGYRLTQKIARIREERTMYRQGRR